MTSLDVRIRRGALIKYAQTTGEADETEDDLVPPDVPVTPLQLAMTGGMGVGLPYGISRLLGSPIGLGHAARLGFGTVALPFTAASDVFTAPLSEPGYQRGERGYFASILPGLARKMDSLEAAGVEARRRYGLGGIPVQMLHGLLNPVSSVGLLARNLGRAVAGGAENNNAF